MGFEAKGARAAYAEWHAKWVTDEPQKPIGTKMRDLFARVTSAHKRDLGPNTGWTDPLRSITPVKRIHWYDPELKQRLEKRAGK